MVKHQLIADLHAVLQCNIYNLAYFDL